MRNNWFVVRWLNGERQGFCGFTRYDKALDACQETVDLGMEAEIKVGPDNPGEYEPLRFLPGQNVRDELHKR